MRSEPWGTPLEVERGGEDVKLMKLVYNIVQGAVQSLMSSKKIYIFDC